MRNNVNPFLVQRQMTNAIKRLSKEYKRCLAKVQLKLVSDSQTMPINKFKEKYLDEE